MTTRYHIHNRSVRWWAAYHTGPKYHALLCDPPYHLTSITKRFGGADAAPAQFGTDGAFARASRGFMGKQWDGGDVAFNPDTWAALVDHLYPGAFGMAFASSRGWHRMAVAIEDAGLIIHPSIFGWGFGSGFPKATRVSDERFGGHRYGLQALKPALEPIIVFQKPYEGRPVDNITETGAGALNIDGARIAGTWERSTPWKNDIRGGNYVTSHGRIMEVEPQEAHPGGRWPANLVLSEEAARRLDEQTGVLQSGAMKAGLQRTQPSSYFNKMPTEAINRDSYADSGGASRFFFTFQEDQLESADPLYYAAKADKDEREAGLNIPHKTVDDGRQKSIDNPYQRGETPRRNTHPTVKPIDLTRWLATLLLPPAGYEPRRILIPFAGSGSEMIGAMRAGWDVIDGIEMTREYAEIARARMHYWSGIGVQMPLFEMEAKAA